MSLINMKLWPIFAIVGRGFFIGCIGDSIGSNPSSYVCSDGTTVSNASQCSTACGNGSCDIGETCSSCSQDCGNCQPTQYCGDGKCNNGEMCSTCSQDCGTCASISAIPLTIFVKDRINNNFPNTQGGFSKIFDISDVLWLKQSFPSFIWAYYTCDTFLSNIFVGICLNFDISDLMWLNESSPYSLWTYHTTCGYNCGVGANIMDFSKGNSPPINTLYGNISFSIINESSLMKWNVKLVTLSNGTIMETSYGPKNCQSLACMRNISFKIPCTDQYWVSIKFPSREPYVVSDVSLYDINLYEQTANQILEYCKHN
jgi:hypothetical protein